MTDPKDTRLHFHDDLDALERKVLGMVGRANDMVGRAVNSVVVEDIALADEVIAEDVDLDQTYFEVQKEWTALMARHQPLGSDLRRMTVMLQLSNTFERMGDQAVNIAKTTHLNAGLPAVEKISTQIREMADLVRPMIHTATEAYVRGDLDEARLLPAMDEPVDRLNANMYREALSAAGDPGQLEWAARMLLVSRALERIGDQAVDFAEQAAYLITGERAEFESPNSMTSDAQSA